ncbi:MAG: DNA-processing protein DprA [Alphaproteobacteria bacterium]|nr:DNA-processing protein DprA [Alphaproteobacteria bacterium]MCZ6847741.1 DNA-processing protein DprA [Alphaproteobacteria bacterium]
MNESRPLGDGERLDWLRLIRSENVGPITFRQLMTRFGSAHDALEALPDLARRGGSSIRIGVCPKSAAEKEMAALAKIGGRLIASDEPEYPQALAALADAPPLLSVVGHPHLLGKPMIAMVGARNGSANGIRFTETLARDLSEAGFVVASGLARGIDAAAHRGAIDGGTVAVMAGGIDIVYPTENQPLYREIAERGVLISELRLGVRPQARHFPNRNRIVSGLAVAVVVIEATLRSGSLITARLAGEQGRDVMAVPGNPLDPRARGANKLIREGAALIEGADDVLEALAGTGAGHPAAEPGPPPLTAGPAAQELDEEALSTAREEITALLGAASTPVDEILRRSGVPPAHVTMILLELELAGRLQRHPGGQVSLAFD